MSLPKVAVVGVDMSGAVIAELSESRELIRVVVSSGWERLFSSGELGSRIFAAYSDGLSKLPRISYADLLASSGGGGQNLDAKLREFDGPPRSIGSYTEDAKNAMDRAVGLLLDLRTAAIAARAPKQPDIRTVAFRLSGHWLSGCDVNVGWAARRSGAEISMEVASALARAKSDTGDQEKLADVQGQVQEAVGALLSLGNEAIAALGYYRGEDANEGGD